MNNEILSILRGMFRSNAYSCYADEKEQRRAYRAAFAAARGIDGICGLRKYGLSLRLPEVKTNATAVNSENAGIADPHSMESRIRSLSACLDQMPSRGSDSHTDILYEVVEGLLHIAGKNMELSEDDKGTVCLSPAASAIATKALSLAASYLGLGSSDDQQMKNPEISINIIR